MVILAVIGLLMILTVLSATLGDAAVALETQHRVLEAREANYQMARSATELAMDLLKVDDNKYDGVGDLWAFGSQRLLWEGKPLLLEIRDEDGRFPLTEALKDGEPDKIRPYTRALESLLTRNGLNAKEAIASLQDWVDPDDETRSGGGESGVYREIRVKNGPLDSLDELRYVQRWGPPTLPPPPPLNPGSLTQNEIDKFKVPVQGKESKELDTITGSRQDTWVELANSSEWSDWLTIWSAGRVNLNTAPVEVLKSLDEQMSDTVVNEIDSQRQKKSFESVDDLKKTAGIDSDLAFRLTKVAGFTSQFFRIRVVVDSTPGRIQLDTVVSRSGGDPKIIWWKVN